MRVRFSLLLLSAFLLAPGAASAEDGLALLQRIAQGSRQLTYSGVFVYRSGDRVDTSRIAHAVSDGVEVERIEALDGSPREVLRVGSEVKCFLPGREASDHRGPLEPARFSEPAARRSGQFAGTLLDSGRRHRAGCRGK
jgi:sigma-E factor negative regulatory protein RseB